MSKRLEGKLVVVVLHPAIDRTLEIPRFHAGGVLPGKTILVEPAGKGVNVARTLSRLGNSVAACGFFGRRDVEFFRSVLDRKRIAEHFVLVDADTRCNITLLDRSRQTDTHIIEKMRVSRKEVERFLTGLGRLVERGDWVVFSGSSPDGMRLADFARALRICRERGAEVCMDTSGSPLRTALKSRPCIIKPNREELEKLTGRTLRSRASILNAARPLLKQCGQVVVSLGAQGALLIRSDEAWAATETRRTKVVNTVGCGDALLAGYLFAYARGASPGEALRFGVACGSACARTLSAVIPSQAQALKYKARVTLTRLA